MGKTVQDPLLVAKMGADRGLGWHEALRTSASR
jgi:hypothetical protein